LAPDERSYEEKELLGRLAAGDETAFNAIYKEYNAMIFSAAMIYVKDVNKAREVVQQVFVNLWEKRKIVVTIENFQSYIIVSSRNLIYDHFRKENTEAKKIAELANREAGIKSQTGSDHAEEREVSRMIQSAILHLSPQKKKIYLMVHEEQLTYKQVAEALGLSPFTVKKHLELARRLIREYVIQNSTK